MKDNTTCARCTAHKYIIHYYYLNYISFRQIYTYISLCVHIRVDVQYKDYTHVLHWKSIHFACEPTKPSSKRPVSGTAAFASVEAALQPERMWPWPPRYHPGSKVPQSPAAALVHLGLKRRLSEWYASAKMH